MTADEFRAAVESEFARLDPGAAAEARELVAELGREDIESLAEAVAESEAAAEIALGERAGAGATGADPVAESRDVWRRVRRRTRQSISRSRPVRVLSTRGGTAPRAGAAALALALINRDGPRTSSGAWLAWLAAWREAEPVVDSDAESVHSGPVSDPLTPNDLVQESLDAFLKALDAVDDPDEASRIRTEAVLGVLRRADRSPLKGGRLRVYDPAAGEAVVEVNRLLRQGPRNDRTAAEHREWLGDLVDAVSAAMSEHRLFAAHPATSEPCALRLSEESGRIELRSVFEEKGAAPAFFDPAREGLELTRPPSELEPTPREILLRAFDAAVLLWHRAGTPGEKTPEPSPLLAELVKEFTRASGGQSALALLGATAERVLEPWVNQYLRDHEPPEPGEGETLEGFVAARRALIHDVSRVLSNFGLAVWFAGGSRLCRLDFAVPRTNPKGVISLTPLGEAGPVKRYTFISETAANLARRGSLPLLPLTLRTTFDPQAGSGAGRRPSPGV